MRMMKQSSFLSLSDTILIILILSCINLNGQVERMAFELFTMSDGLSDNTTSAILQDSRGFIWIGTQQGLSCFDGRKFRNFRKLGYKGLSDLKIHTLAEDSEGNIWIGTQYGLNRLNPYSDEIVQYPEGAGSGTIPYKWCNSLFTDNQQNLWLSTEKGLARYIKDADAFENHIIKVCGNDTRINKFIADIFEDSKNRLWLATSYGITLFDRANGSTQHFTYEKTFKKGLTYPVMAITEDSQGNIWAGTWNDGLLKLDESTMTFKFYRIPNISFNTLAIKDMMSMTINNKECLLMTTNAGLLVLDLQHGHKASFSLTGNYLERFLKDRQGNLWLTGLHGLYKLIPNSLAFEWIHLPETFSQSNVYQIIPDIRMPENLFYLSTLSGWWLLNKREKKIAAKPLPFDPGKLITTINHWIPDSNGYWFTSMNGIGFYNPYSNKMNDLTVTLSNRSTVPFTKNIVKDKQNNLWISVYRSGILQFNTITKANTLHFANDTENDNIRGSDIRDVILLGDSTLLFAANYKLYKLDIQSLKYEVLSLPAQDFQIDIEKDCPDNFCLTPFGKLYVCSKLQVFGLNNAGFRKVFPKKGFADFEIDKMHCLPDGTIWALTSRGIFKTDTSFANWININNRLSWSEREYISVIQPCSDGSVLFAARGKIGILDPGMLSVGPLPPEVVMGIKTDESDIISTKAADLKKLHFAYKQPLEIVLSTVNFIDPAETRLMYRLDGWSKDTLEHKGSVPLVFHQLPHGNYRFTTWQTNAVGQSGPVAGFSFKVHPPFYLEWWFIVLNLIALMTAAFLLSRYRHRKAIELERLRTRIATDLHDDVGATLSAIALYADALKIQTEDTHPQHINLLSKISDSSREMVNSMSDIVWAIKPDNDLGDRFINRMRNHAADVCQARDIQLHFEADGLLSSMRMPLEMRKSIYLIFKEALNNALKYSRASNICVSLLQKGNLVIMTISDDGIGFELQGIRHGNGLKNIYTRAISIGANLVIETCPGAGTVIKLQWKRK